MNDIFNVYLVWFLQNYFSDWDTTMIFIRDFSSRMIVHILISWVKINMCIITAKWKLTHYQGFSKKAFVISRFNFAK